MTVKQLIEHLQAIPEEQKDCQVVYPQYPDYGEPCAARVDFITQSDGKTPLNMTAHDEKPFEFQTDQMVVIW
jgi:hypothetical protein